jgi:spermidine/putrescine-binding protein
MQKLFAEGVPMPGVIGRRGLLRWMGAGGLALVSLPILSRGALADDDLLVFDWSGYEIPELHQAYIKKYGKSPTITIFGDDEEAYVKIKSGFKTDLVHPTSYAIGRYRDQGLMPKLASRPGMNTDGHQWIAPCGWGYNSVLYRTDLCQPKEQSWLLLWDERYKGKIALAVEMDGSVIPAAMSLGIKDPFNMSDAEIAQVKDHLRKQRELNRFYWTDPAELEQAMAAGEVVAAYAWGASFSALKKQGVPVAYMKPKEGVIGWIDGFIMMKDGPGKEQYGYAHSNRKAFDLVSPDRLKEIGIESKDDILSQGVFLQEQKAETREKYVKMYEDVKAGQ